MKRILFVFVSILSLIFLAAPAWAQETNKFGIHILDPSELQQAAELVNSSGGDWGFVTIVIRDDVQYTGSGYAFHSRRSTGNQVILKQAYKKGCVPNGSHPF